MQSKLMYKAGLKSLEYIPKDTKTVVFGAGRTVCQALQAFYDQGLHKNINVVCASLGTEEFAKKLGIMVINRNQIKENKYLYIDGADQIDPKLNLLKGGNKNTGNPGIEASMYKEKELAYPSNKFIIIADSSKLVSYLGENNYGLAIEYNPKNEFEVKQYLKSIFSGHINRRTFKNNPFITENNNYVFDVEFDGRKYNLKDLEKNLSPMHNIFSTGLFALRKPNQAIIAKDTQISTSIFGVEEKDLTKILKSIPNSNYLHIDVTDGIFVKDAKGGASLLFDDSHLKKIKQASKVSLDVHLMVANPIKHIQRYAQHKPDIITFHYEATNDHQAVIDEIKKYNIKAGIAINPDTPISSIQTFLDSLDLVLLMSVIPGRSGQSYIPKVTKKINHLRKLTDILIEVDGGIKLHNKNIPLLAGADILVSGTGILNQDEDPETLINKMRDTIVIDNES